MSTQAAPQAVATTPHAAPGPGLAEAGHPHRSSIVAVLGAVAFIAQLDFFIINVTLGGIRSVRPRTRDSATALLVPVLSAYTIIFAAVLRPAGQITDHLEHQDLLLCRVALLFTLQPPPSRLPRPQVSACSSVPGLSRP